MLPPECSWRASLMALVLNCIACHLSDVVNKPKGFLCSAKPSHREGENKKLVLDLFDQWIKSWKKSNPEGKTPPRLFTVGRLDVNSYGLLLVTNDGQWAQKVAHPSSGLTKEYVIRVDSKPTSQQVQAVLQGCEVEGRHVSPVAVRLENQRTLRVVVSDGRKRELRVLVDHAGLTVEALKRVCIGMYRLPSDLKIGQIRELKNNDLRKILHVATPRGTSMPRRRPRKS